MDGKQQKFDRYNAFDLMNMNFPEPKWAVPGLLTEGLNILAGKPKHGKSILAWLQELPTVELARIAEKLI